MIVEIRINCFQTKKGKVVTRLEFLIAKQFFHFSKVFRPNTKFFFHFKWFYLISEETACILFQPHMHVSGSIKHNYEATAEVFPLSEL